MTPTPTRRLAVLLVGALTVTMLFLALSGRAHGGQTARNPGPAHTAHTSALAPTTVSGTSWPSLTISRAYGQCGREDQGVIYTDRPGSAKQLIPSGAKAVTVCRYNGMNPFGGAPDWALRAKGQTDDGTTVTGFATALNQMTRFTGGARHCPADDGSKLIATFTYASGRTDVVADELGGCSGVTNGWVDRDEGASAALAQLTALAEPVTLTWARIVGTCAPHCRGADMIGASRDHVELAFTAIGAGGRFSVPLALPGRYVLTLQREDNTIVGRTTATVKLGHTTTVHFRAAAG